MKYGILVPTIAASLVSASVQALDMKTFAQSMGYQPLNPPQRVLNADSNLWKPGTVIYLDKVKKVIYTIPACELLFTEPPASTPISFSTSGSIDENKSNALGIALDLLKGLIEKVTGSINAKFDSSKHLKVSYTGLGSLTSTDVDMMKAARKSTVQGEISSDCAKVLAGPKFNSGTATRLRFKFPVFVITATGLARGMKIELTSQAKAELGADFKVTDVVSVKPTWNYNRTTNESIEIEALELPVIWGYRAEPVALMLKVGAVAAAQTFDIEFGEPEVAASLGDLQDAGFAPGTND